MLVNTNFSHKSGNLFIFSRWLVGLMDTSGVLGNKAYRFSSPQVQTLVKLLETHNNECNSRPENKREPLQALIFVQEKMTAKVLSSVLKVSLKLFSHNLCLFVKKTLRNSHLSFAEHS